jgi:hypothetical protein
MYVLWLLLAATSLSIIFGFCYRRSWVSQIVAFADVGFYLLIIPLFL